MTLPFLLSRIAEDGTYRSPNVCFMDDPDPPEDHDEGGDGGDDGGDADAGDDSGEDAGDADADGDEAPEDAGDEGDAVAEEADEPPAPKRRSASDVIRENKRGRKAAAREAEEAKREAAEARREASALKERLDAADRRALERQRSESEAEERQRVELMSDVERANYYREQDRTAHQREMNQVRSDIWASEDRASFRELCREDKLVASVKDRVEQVFAQQQAQGRPVSRELIANQEIARMAREGRLKAQTTQRARADERLRRQRSKPVTARSAAPSTRTRRGEGDEKAARLKRLENVTL